MILNFVQRIFQGDENFSREVSYPSAPLITGLLAPLAKEYKSEYTETEQTTRHDTKEQWIGMKKRVILNLTTVAKYLTPNTLQPSIAVMSQNQIAFNQVHVISE